MSPSALINLTETAPTLIPSARSLIVQQLTREHQAEVLAFLALRPLHTVFMTGFIRDNGLVSPLNRGTFYGCRNTKGQLEGVALVGHATLFETSSEEALAAFARLAQGVPRAHMVMGEQEKIEKFWSYYAEDARSRRLICRELLFEQRWPVMVRERVEGLRLATLGDIELILPVHAEQAFEESGVNPLETDPEGFRNRAARRIEQGRVWVLVEDGRLIFKADVISDTPEVAYLEGIYVDPEERGKSYGLNCLTQLSRGLLERTRSICLFIGARKQRAQAFYGRAGYRLHSHYEAIFLRPGGGG